MRFLWKHTYPKCYSGKNCLSIQYYFDNYFISLSVGLQYLIYVVDYSVDYFLD